MKRSKYTPGISSLHHHLIHSFIVTAPRLVIASKVKKAMPKGGDVVVQSPNKDDVQYPCLVRAVYRKQKISTIVQ